MNFLNIAKRFALIAFFVFAALPLATAYQYNYPYPSYFGGQTRMGAYTTSWGSMGYAQGMYNYISPPIGLTRYGADYNIYNIRGAVYPAPNYARVPNMYRPYYGYPYISYGRAPYFHYTQYN